MSLDWQSKRIFRYGWWRGPEDLASADGYSPVQIEVYTADGQDTCHGVSDQCEQGNTSGHAVFFLAPGSYKLNLYIVGSL